MRQLDLFGASNATNMSTRSSRLANPLDTISPLESANKSTRRARRSKQAPKPVPSFRTWQCMVLGVDTASRSGWALRQAGKLLYSGEVSIDDDAELDAIVRTAIHHRWCMPSVLVLERPWRSSSVNVIMSLGAARKAWLNAWKRAGQSQSRVVSVYPVTWRSRVGVAQPIPRVKLSWDEKRARRDVGARMELAAAQTEVSCTCNVGPDEAAAILISRWAAHAPDVGEALPKRCR